MLFNTSGKRSFGQRFLFHHFSDNRTKSIGTAHLGQMRTCRWLRTMMMNRTTCSWYQFYATVAKNWPSCIHSVVPLNYFCVFCIIAGSEGPNKKRERERACYIPRLSPCLISWETNNMPMPPLRPRTPLYGKQEMFPYRQEQMCKRGASHWHCDWPYCCRQNQPQY